MFEYINSILKDNNLAQGGLLLLFGGSIMGIFYKLYFRLVQLFYYFFFVKLTFESIDHLNFKKMQYWLYNLPYCKNRCTNFNIRHINKKYTRDSYVNDEEKDQIFYPGYGNHYLFLYYRPAIINYSKSDSKELAFRETITINIFAFFNKTKLAEKLIAEVNHLYEQVEYEKTSIYTCVDTYGSWTELLSKNVKQQPILSYENEYKELLNDIDIFLQKEDWYAKRGIGYKRGYLFSGTPGAGKTSAILSLAQHFKRHIYILNLTSTSLDDSKFIELVSNLNKDAILAIEDIDGIYIDRKQKKEGPDANTITLSTILNVLDGLFTPDGLLFFITTNYPEKLDKALIRPGRISVFKDFKNSNRFQAETIFKRFFPEANKNQIDSFANCATGKPMSELESHLIKNSENIEMAAIL